MRAEAAYRAVRHHWKGHSFAYEVKCGNVLLDIVVDGSIAIEVKSDMDDVVRGIADLAFARAHGYAYAVLVTSKRQALRLDKRVFEAYGFGLAYAADRGKNLVWVINPEGL